MIIGEALIAQLKLTATVKAKVGRRVYPIAAPPREPMPYITVHQISDPPIHKMKADSTLRYPRYQVSCWGKNFTQARQLADAVIMALRDFSGTMGGDGGVTVQRAFYEGAVENLEQTTGSYHIPVDFIIWYEG